MTIEQILKMVDRCILQSFEKGNNITDIQSELENKKVKFKSILIRDMDNVEKILVSDWDDIESSKARYGSFYIRSCSKRIEDLDWIIKNKNKFNKYSYSEVFQLSKFKETLLKLK